MARSRSYIATPPGATIKEQLEDRGMTQKEFASRMGMSEKHISHLINGDVKLTSDVAYRLEMVLGLSAKFWNNLESLYREKLAMVDAENALDSDIELARKFPYKEMAKYGWVPDSSKIEDRVINLRKFFEVVQLCKLENTSLIPAIAYRRLSITEKSDFSSIAWAQKVKIEARTIKTSPIDLSKIREHLSLIRAMTVKTPEEFCGELCELLGNCGVALVFLPHIHGSFLHGATFYDKGKIVIGLTVRGKDADKFWFSLFHEIGHILLGHLNQSNGLDKSAEKAANQFAKDTLIPMDDFDAFVKRDSFTKESLLEFADKIGIAPGIVVGRLQKEEYLEFNQYNDLKAKYKLTM